MDSIDFVNLMSPSLRPLDPKILELLSASAAEAEKRIRASIESADHFIARVTVAVHGMNNALDVPGSAMVGPV